MKKTLLLLSLLFVTTLSYSQKKERVKGSKIVTTEIKKIESFKSLEVNDNLEVFIIKGTQCGLEIEADDNLHETIDAVISGSNLKLSTLKEAFGYKKLSIRVTYTDDFNLVVTHNESSVTALADIELENITFKSYDESKLYLNSKSKNLSILMDDKSKGELNTAGDNLIISLVKNASLKALVNNTATMTLDMYQKSDVVLNGAIENCKFRMDNNTQLDAKNCLVQNAEIICEAYSNASIHVKKTLAIEASGKAEIELYGDQKIDLRRFVDNAILRKKPTK
ncbi:GIN domain-containing protein [Flavobacterium aciduliphilum]|uniref:Putative autotransporter adhesin-like protein n=1 Tax=Flavobacterium aciduliphilum TaxID=1101402 RepID=A0A328YRU2_9FLAO|nr:DUF2807 domain-containing protein [Flavobacterium aciduliphilum]RAR75485.1 putative autotransporter adhesin-like protein [Flavobacterium aciduliphilum]